MVLYNTVSCAFFSSHHRSESPSQVFLIAIHYLMARLGSLTPEKWKEFTLSYDNMCNVDSMRIARTSLPIQSPYDRIWLNVNKVIDDLHMRNHKRQQCREKYSTESVRESCPGLNTPVAEQTFTWAARFKKIICAMPQRHAFFYYHRMVTRRNRYTSRCHKNKRTPYLPKVRSTKTT